MGNGRKQNDLTTSCRKTSAGERDTGGNYEGGARYSHRRNKTDNHGEGSAGKQRKRETGISKIRRENSRS